MDNQTEYFTEQELSEVLASLDQTEAGLTEEQLEKVQNAWSHVNRNNLYNKVEKSD